MAIFPWIVAAITSLFNWIASFSGTIVGGVAIKAAEWLAWKKLIWFLLFTIVPIVAYNIMSTIIVDLIKVTIDLTTEYSQGFEPGSITDLSLNLTGFGGWLAQQLYIPQAVAMYLSAVAARFTMSFIPFLK